MIRFLAKATIEAIIVVSLLIGALWVYVEYGPQVESQGAFAIGNPRGKHIWLDWHLYKKAPPAAQTIQRIPSQKG